MSNKSSAAHQSKFITDLSEFHAQNQVVEKIQLKKMAFTNQVSAIKKTN